MSMPVSVCEVAVEEELAAAWDASLIAMVGAPRAVAGKIKKVH